MHSKWYLTKCHNISCPEENYRPKRISYTSISITLRANWSKYNFNSNWTGIKIITQSTLFVSYNHPHGFSIKIKFGKNFQFSFVDCSVGIIQACVCVESIVFVAFCHFFFLWWFHFFPSCIGLFVFSAGIRLQCQSQLRHKSIIRSECTVNNFQFFVWIVPYANNWKIRNEWECTCKRCKVQMKKWKFIDLAIQPGLFLVTCVSIIDNRTRLSKKAD